MMVAGQEAQEGGCFCAKAPTHFQAHDDQAAPPGRSLAPRCCGVSAPRLDISLRVGLARTCERGDERGVNSESRWPRLRCACRPRRARRCSCRRRGRCERHAHRPRGKPAQRLAEVCEHAAGSARGTVVPESVEPATTAARAGGRWQGQAQEQNAELRVRNGHGLVRGRDGDGSGRVWPSLRQQQRTVRKGEVRRNRLAPALVARSGSLALPSP